MSRCKDFAEVGEVISKVRAPPRPKLQPCPTPDPSVSLAVSEQVAFRSLLSITPTLIHHPPAPQPSFSLVFEENPLTDFVELPEDVVDGGLNYAKILEGVIRGALEMVSTAESKDRQAFPSKRGGLHSDGLIFRGYPSADSDFCDGSNC